MRFIDAYTPGCTPEQCTYGPDYWCIVRSERGLLAGRMDAQGDAAAEAEAQRETKYPVVAVVRLRHVAYNIGPSLQTQADWALEAATKSLGESYAVRPAVDEKAGSGDENAVR